MSSILESHFSELIKLDMAYYKLYKIIIKNYLKNKNGIDNITDEELRKFVYDEYDRYYNEEEKKKKNEEFKNNLVHFNEDDFSKIPELTSKIYLCTLKLTTVSSDKLNELFNPATYFEDYFKCIEKLYLGFNLKGTKDEPFKFTLSYEKK